MSPKGSKRKKDKKLLKIHDSLTCKPLDSYSEIILFLENPPPWRTLCKGMTPHSNLLIRNLEINRYARMHSLELPEHFCHFDPEVEEPERYEEKTLRKTMVCHDMANGYHDDCIIEGTGNYEGYTFYNWAGIDIFCYFSHHLITIPPVGYINMGHAHGVKVIGTIITEWADGINFWDQVLVSKTEYENLASALVAIAKTLKFDGYLLNVENKISRPEMLLEFVRYFHTLLHQELEHAVLVWYDSVTVQGNLNWQNKLNDKNKAFFDACDGFFTNYSWSVNDVTDSAALAEERVTDLYIGIDVWGRNFFGGGQFNTQEAIKVAYYSGCSIAIFAPAWTHESLSTEKNDPNRVVMADNLDQYHLALLRDRALWGSFWPFLNTRVPCQMPFQTSFCRGLGMKRRLYGEVLSPTPWYNLRHQQYQPNAMHGPHCYMLSASGTIPKARGNVHKDKTGIIRYNSSFVMMRHDLHSKGSFYNPTSSVLNTNESSLPTSVPAKTDDDIDIIDSPKEKKRTFKDALKSLFKYKSHQNQCSTRTPESEGQHKPYLPETKEEIVKSREKTDDKSGEKMDVKLVERIDDNRVEKIDDKIVVQNHDPLVGPGSSTMHSTPSLIRLRLGASAEKLRYCLAWVADEQECLEHYLDDSFNGGACLKVNPSDRISRDHRYIRLFFCDFRCENTLVFCVVTKTLSKFPYQSLNVHLFMKNEAKQDLKIMLTGREVAYTTKLDRMSSGVKYMYPLSTTEGEEFKDLRTYLLLNEPGFYVPVDNSFDWEVRYYQISVPGSSVTSINVRTALPIGGILLGHFGVCHRVMDIKEPQSETQILIQSQSQTGNSKDNII